MASILHELAIIIALYCKAIFATKVCALFPDWALAGLYILCQTHERHKKKLSLKQSEIVLFIYCFEEEFESDVKLKILEFLQDLILLGFFLHELTQFTQLNVEWLAFEMGKKIGKNIQKKTILFIHSIFQFIRYLTYSLMHFQLFVPLYLLCMFANCFKYSSLILK